MNKGAYVLILRLEEITVSAARKTWQLQRGYYVYVGSAMGTLTGRLKHHLEDKNSQHWHVDRLEPEKTVVAAIAVPSSDRIEEELSRYLLQVGDPVYGFGCSDSCVDANLFKVDQGAICGLILEIFNMRRERL